MEFRAHGAPGVVSHQVTKTLWTPRFFSSDMKTLKSTALPFGVALWLRNSGGPARMACIVNPSCVSMVCAIREL